MVDTLSTMMPLGTKAPGFSLFDTISEKTLSLQELKSPKATVIMFICNHCPFVVHILPELIKLGHEYQKKGLSFVAISSNDAQTYPQDAPDKMKIIAQKNSFPFPYLYDETQDVARSYQAACTPDFYVFDGQLTCVYRGQLDDSRPKNSISPSGKDLREALENILKGIPVDPEQKPSMGCNIKWKK